MGSSASTVKRQEFNFVFNSKVKIAVLIKIFEKILEKKQFQNP
jgi:hypothetical protein